MENGGVLKISMEEGFEKRQRRSRFQEIYDLCSICPRVKEGKERDSNDQFPFYQTIRIPDCKYNYRGTSR